MSERILRILNLYPRQLNIYGDTGNLLVLRRRAEWRDISVEIVNFEPDSDAALLTGIDLIVGGGGQDSGQAVAQADLLRIGAALKQLIEDDVPALVICGSFQLFGTQVKSSNGDVWEGIDIFDMYTEATTERQIGNIVTYSDTFGELIGYENHSGKTYLGTDLAPLARVTSGFGNNGEDAGEGAQYRNALGTYLHGPLLPKNPQIADFLIARGLERRYGESFELAPLDDIYLEQARAIARTRPR